jgi:hypothetical protein
MYFFAGLKKNLTWFWTKLRFWCRVFLTLRQTLLCQDVRQRLEARSLQFIKMFFFQVLDNQLGYQVFEVFKKSILKVSILIN